SFSDATTDSEQDLTFAHRLVRKMIYGFSDAFIGASQKTLLLFKSYGATSKNSFQSCLCIDNSRFSACHKPQVERDYDIMLSGQFSARKMINFSAEVILEIHRRNPGIKILLIGDGPDRAYMVEKLSTNKVDFHYAGFVTQDALPEYYGNAKLLFFPSLNDPWGVVANEACAAGTPIMTVSGVGAANELVIHNENGLVLPLNAETWTKEALGILDDQLRWERMSTSASESVQRYNYTSASNGFIDAAHSVESS
ncbi:MAG TPA: glycosyltransferase family 1 protein, partial [Pseudomonadales bacterium]|nr:glycosyltransferase family 1 protein [Pseudomonadales bacterium]